ncbi:MAG: acyl-ACP--UDP-N-acetylglucosamine O-acyltransferase [Gammaproteobacteria bacterium]
MIHPTAIIHPEVKIGANVEIGPFCVIGEDVEIGDDCVINSHVVINGPTVLGKANRIYPFCALGGDPQDKKFQRESTSNLQIGDGNTIREFCTINRGTAGGGGITRVGNNNWIMAYVHIAHDCQVGNDTIFANNATLAGHVAVEDHVILGGFTGVHQFCRLGKHSFSAISSVIVKDVPPFIMVSGNTAKPFGLNKEGLKRQGMEAGRIELIRKAYKIVYKNGFLLKEAIEKLEALAADSQEVAAFTDFIKTSERGIVR